VPPGRGLSTGINSQDVHDPLVDVEHKQRWILKLHSFSWKHIWLIVAIQLLFVMWLIYFDLDFVVFIWFCFVLFCFVSLRSVHMFCL
jgi:membrane protein required for beta-lactamase induction